MKQGRGSGFWKQFAVGGALVAAVAVASMGLMGAQSAAASCIFRYVALLEQCAELPTWWQRSACGTVAYLDYLECLARIPFGG